MDNNSIILVRVPNDQPLTALGKFRTWLESTGIPYNNVTANSLMMPHTADSHQVPWPSEDLHEAVVRFLNEQSEKEHPLRWQEIGKGPSGFPEVVAGNH